MIYWDSSWATIHWDESCQAVWAEWKSYCEGEQIHSAVDAGLGCLKKNRSNRWLGDVRNLGPLRQEDQRWTNEDWFPRAIAAGLRWIAIVNSKSTIARLSIRNIIAKINGAEITTANFDDLEAARAWLRNPIKLG